MAEHQVSISFIGIQLEEADQQKFSRNRIAQKVLAEEITELVHGRMSSRTDLTLFAFLRVYSHHTYHHTPLQYTQ